MCIVEIHEMDIISINKTMTESEQAKTYTFFVVALKRAVFNAGSTKSFTYGEELPVSFIGFLFY